MAVIGKIREKSSLVLIIVGIAMLAFLLPTNNVRNLFTGNDSSVGEIGGIEIEGKDFEFRQDKAVSQWETQNKQTATTEVRDAIKEQVWNDIIRESVLESQFKELGIAVSSQELFDMVQGSDPHPQVKQAFTDPNTNVFDPAKVLQFLKSLETMPAENKNQWLLFEEGIEKERVATKYNNLFVKGMYATSSMLKRTYKDQNEKRNIRFVAKRYVTVNDSTITVSPDELKAYYDEHKNEYKQDASREIEYVKFEVVPSEADIAEAKKWIQETAEEFKITENDSSFVTYNSEVPFDEKFYGPNNMPQGIDSAMYFAEVGTTTKPYEQDGAFMVTKLSKTKIGS